MEIEKKLYSEIKDYCSINNLKIGDFVNKLLRKAFNIEKYGVAPPFLKENSVEKEENNKPIETEESNGAFEFVEKTENGDKENLNNNLDKDIKNDFELKPRKRRKLN